MAWYEKVEFIITRRGNPRGTVIGGAERAHVTPHPGRGEPDLKLTDATWKHTWLNYVNDPITVKAMDPEKQNEVELRYYKVEKEDLLVYGGPTWGA